MTNSAVLNKIWNDFMTGVTQVPQGWPSGLPTSLLHADLGGVDQFVVTEWNDEPDDRSNRYLVRSDHVVAEIRFTDSDQGQLIWSREFDVEAFAKAYYRRRRRQTRLRLR